MTQPAYKIGLTPQNLLAMVREDLAVASTDSEKSTAVAPLSYCGDLNLFDKFTDKDERLAFVKDVQKQLIETMQNVQDEGVKNKIADYLISVDNKGKVAAALSVEDYYEFLDTTQNSLMKTMATLKEESVKRTFAVKMLDMVCFAHVSETLPEDKYTTLARRTYDNVLALREPDSEEKEFYYENRLIDAMEKSAPFTAVLTEEQLQEIGYLNIDQFVEEIGVVDDQAYVFRAFAENCDEATRKKYHDLFEAKCTAMANKFAKTVLDIAKTDTEELTVQQEDYKVVKAMQTEFAPRNQ